MRRIIAIVLGIVLLLSAVGCSQSDVRDVGRAVNLIAENGEDLIDTVSGYLDYYLYGDVGGTTVTPVSMDSIPEYTDTPYVIINSNDPFFEESDYTTDAFETYSDLDALGRCGEAYANICLDIMPAEERGDISSVHPSGWTSGNDPASWNRCHLIGFQLAGENDNEKNLITGTNYMNVEGMLPFENQVDDYVERTGNHVLYRVTPIYDGANLIADGVLMEAYSVEDNGAGICFCVYCYNVQPDVHIDYATGSSWYE